MPPDDELETGTTTDDTETTDDKPLAGAAATSALRKERKARQETEKELKALRDRFKKIEDAEKSETERLRAELDELRTEREHEQKQATAEREERSKRDVVRRAASEFADPEDAIAHLSLRDALGDIEDEDDAKRALKQLAKDKPYLLKKPPSGGPLDEVLHDGLPPGQAELDRRLSDPSRPKTGDEMYAMSDDEFLAWKRTYPDAYRQSLEGWTGNELIASTQRSVAVTQ